MEKNLSLLPVIFTAGVLFAVLILIVQAGPKDGIVYPVQELGGCKDETACRVYCDARDNLERAKTCIEFAKTHGLLSPEELKEAEYYVIARGITSGPGGCKNQISCDLYCEDTAHLGECLDFAEQHELRSREEIAEGRKIIRALQGGSSLPGGCRTKKECEAYCENPSHMRECVAFAKSAGFISEEEAAEAEKIIPLLEQGEKTPGNCARKEACEAYCYDPSHIDECLAFAQKAGLIAPEELAEAKQVARFIKSGETPGGCRRKSECEEYCADIAHFDECVAFGEKAGLMSKADVELAKKTKGMGPGGCASKEACEAFCRKPENQETCVRFIKEHGLEEEFSGIVAEERAKADAEIQACYEKPCKEMISCFEGLTARGGGGEENLPAEVKAKLDSCIAEMVKELGGDAGEGGEHPRVPRQGSESSPEEQGATKKEDQRQSEEQYKQEYQRQYEEEYKKQYDAEIQQYCHLFEAAPTCDLAASPGSQNYEICKKCFPNK